MGQICNTNLVEIRVSRQASKERRPVKIKERKWIRMLLSVPGKVPNKVILENLKQSWIRGHQASFRKQIFTPTKLLLGTLRLTVEQSMECDLYPCA